MGALLLYILKSTICLILFYLGFKALLSNDTFFRFNRWVLLVGIATCMLLPAIKIQTSEPLLIQQPIIHLEKMIAGEETVVTYLSDNNPEVNMIPVVTPAKMIDWGQIIALLYWAGFIFCLMILQLPFQQPDSRVEPVKPKNALHKKQVNGMMRFQMHHFMRQNLN